MDKDLIVPPPPPEVGVINNETLLNGKNIPALDRLKLFSPSEFEDFVSEWLHGYLKNQYPLVLKAGGPGDKGRDIIAFHSKDMQSWDNYQAKHYDKMLTPGDVYVELGKLCHFTYVNEYTLPKKYYFVTSKGIGPKLISLLGNPKKLQSCLLKEWNKNCKTEITSTQSVVLTPDFKKYIEGIDFSMFSFIPPLEIIEQHSKTPWHSARFGGGLKPRPKAPEPTDKINSYENRYVEQLLEVYSEHSGDEIKKLDDLKTHNELDRHFKRQRKAFFSAEALKGFARDSLPPDVDAFSDLSDEIYNGIVEVVDKNHTDGYEKVEEVMIQASQIQVQSNLLQSHLRIEDRKGICHQLANEDRVIWVKKGKNGKKK